MMYLYMVGIFVAIVNVSLLTRKMPRSCLVANFVILLIGVACMPTYYATFTEITAVQYAEIKQISDEIKDQTAAKKIQTLITQSLDDKSISMKEFTTIKEAYDTYSNEAQKLVIAKNGAKL